MIYIDPDTTPEENIADQDAVRYDSFNDWYEAQLESVRCHRCGSHDVRFVASQDKRWLLRECASCGFEEQIESIEP